MENKMMFEHEYVLALAPAKNPKEGRVVGRCAVTWRGLGPACQRDYSAACPAGCVSNTEQLLSVRVSSRLAQVVGDSAQRAD